MLTLDPVTLTSSPGSRLGSGVHRTGYKLQFGDATFCVKVASYRGANLEEAGRWEHVKDTADADLFCEVLGSSPDGQWLIMPFCEPLAYDGDLPDHLSEEDGWYQSDYGWWFHEDWDTWRRSSRGRRAMELTYDLHAFNVMRHPDGRIVVTDYGTGLAQGGWNPSGGDEGTALCSNGCCLTCGCECED